MEQEQEGANANTLEHLQPPKKPNLAMGVTCRSYTMLFLLSSLWHYTAA
jgi:hypothetical protein